MYCIGGKNLYRTPDVHTPWTMVEQGVYSSPYSFLKSAGGELFRTEDDTLFRSVDQGLNWSQLTVAPSRINDIEEFESDLYIATDSSGVLKSTDGGITWSSSNSGLLSLSVNTLCSFDTVLLAGLPNDSGIVFYDNQAWASVNVDFCQSFSMDEEPNRDKDVHVWPNPASTMFHVEVDGEFTLEIFDISGRSILRSKLKENAVIDVRNLKPGVYQYIIQKNRDVFSGKMIIKE